MTITKAKRDKIATEIMETVAHRGDKLLQRIIDDILKKHLAPGLKPSSAKGKGRRAQQWLQKRLLRIMENVDQRTGRINPDHVRSTPMGVAGEDLMLSPTARTYFPFAFECKNSERIGFWPTVEQAVANAGRYIPVIIFGKNRTDSWIAMPSEGWFQMVETLARELRHDRAETLLDHFEIHGIIQKESARSDKLQSNT